VTILRPAVVLVLLFVGQGQVYAQVLDPPVIVDSFFRARDRGDIDRALSTFADNAVVRLEERQAVAFTGKAEIRKFLMSIGREPPQVTSNRHVVGNTVTWSERTRGQQQTSIDLSVEAVVQEGKIISMMYRVALPQPPAAPQVDGPTRMPAALAPLGLLVLGGGLLLVASLLPPRRASPSALRGKLIAALAAQHHKI
jgi:hypothetical protein